MAGYFIKTEKFQEEERFFQSMKNTYRGICKIHPEDIGRVSYNFREGRVTADSVLMDKSISLLITPSSTSPNKTKENKNVLIRKMTSLGFKVEELE